MSGLAQGVEEDYVATPRHTFVEVYGGVVQHIGGAHDSVHVIDWDNLKSDIVEAWENLSLEARQYLAKMHVNEYVELVARYNKAKGGR